MKSLSKSYCLVWIILTFPMISFAQVVNYTYNALGKLGSVTYPDSSKIQYQYDQNANRTSLTATVDPSTFPIELLSFSGEALSVNLIQLEWITTNEVNNDGFSLERSNRGQIFQEIGWIGATSTPEIQNRYTFDDINVRPGQSYYYRLKQVDLDGTFSYSNILLIGTPNPNLEFDFTIRPNPTSNAFTLKVENYSSFDKAFTYSVLNLLGQEVVSGVSEMSKDATRTISIDVHNFPSGTYTVRIVLDNQNELSKTLLKQ